MLWSPLMLSPILGAPELIVPGRSPFRSPDTQRLINVAGEASYASRISGREEFLPVCVSMMGYPGKYIRSSRAGVATDFIRERP